MVKGIPLRTLHLPTRIHTTMPTLIRRGAPPRPRRLVSEHSGRNDASSVCAWSTWDRPLRIVVFRLGAGVCQPSSTRGSPRTARLFRYRHCSESVLFIATAGLSHLIDGSGVVAHDPPPVVSASLGMAIRRCTPQLCLACLPSGRCLAHTGGSRLWRPFLLALVAGLVTCVRIPSRMLVDLVAASASRLAQWLFSAYVACIAFARLVLRLSAMTRDPGLVRMGFRATRPWRLASSCCVTPPRARARKQKHMLRG